MNQAALKSGAVAVLIGLSACASSDPWYRENITSASFERDKEECKRQAVLDSPGNTIGANLVTAIMMGSNISDCLNKRGYTQVKPKLDEKGK